MFRILTVMTAILSLFAFSDLTARTTGRGQQQGNRGQQQGNRGQQQGNRGQQQANRGQRPGGPIRSTPGARYQAYHQRYVYRDSRFMHNNRPYVYWGGRYWPDNRVFVGNRVQAGTHWYVYNNGRYFHNGRYYYYHDGRYWPDTRIEQNGRFQHNGVWYVYRDGRYFSNGRYFYYHDGRYWAEDEIGYSYVEVYEDELANEPVVVESAGDARNPAMGGAQHYVNKRFDESTKRWTYYHTAFRPDQYQVSGPHTREEALRRVEQLNAAARGEY